MKAIARSSAARQAIKEFRARGLPRASPETEKTFLARYAGRPQDEDLVTVVSMAGTQEKKNRWDLLKSGVPLPMKETVVVRNEVEVPEKEAGGASSGASFRQISDPDTDAMIDIRRACVRELMNAQKVYFLDSNAIGVSSFARVNCTVVTDHPATALALSQMLPKAPWSSQMDSPLESRLKFFHSATSDVEVEGVDSYLTHDNAHVIGRGKLASYTPLLEDLAKISAVGLRGKGVVVMKGNVYADESTGEVTLALGDQGSIQDSAFKGKKLQGAHHIAWGAEGVTRMWEGKLDKAFTPVAASSSMLPHPKNIVFAGKGSQKKADGEALSSAFIEKASVDGQSADSLLFSELVDSFGVQVYTMS